MLIALCDDEPQELSAIEAALAAAASELSAGVEVKAYPSGAALAEAADAGLCPDLAVLDIYMEGLDGMETARRLRRTHPSLPLAFLTTSRDFAVDAFELEALHYILKPVTVEKAKELLQRLFALTQRPRLCLELSGRRQDYRFPLEHIQYILSRDKGTEVHLLDPPRREWADCPFREALEQLSGNPDFLLIAGGAWCTCTRCGTSATRNAT